jgi:hypothetical protein
VSSNHGRLVDGALRAPLDVLHNVILNFRVKFGGLTLLLFMSRTVAIREMGL